MSLEPPGPVASDDEPTSTGPSSDRPAADTPHEDAREAPFVQKPLFDGDLVRAAAAARVEGADPSARPPRPSDGIPEPAPEPEPEPQPSPLPDPKPMVAAPPPLPQPHPAAPEPVAAPVAMAQAPSEPEPPAAVIAPPHAPMTGPPQTEHPEPVTAPVAMAQAPPEPEPPVVAPAAPAAVTRRAVDDGTPRRKREDPRPRARKVRRIMRHVDPWSVLKISLLFYLALFVIVMIAGVVLWGLGQTTGTVDRVESFVTSLGFGNCEVDPDAPPQDSPGVTAPSAPDEDGECGPGEILVGGFQFEGGRLLQGFALAGLVLVIAGAAANTVLALLFNIISDVTGGLRFTVLEEVPPPRPSGSPR
jgi:hypothetical protein